MEILIWFIAAYGLTNILVYGSILQDVRNYIKLIGDSGFSVISPIFSFISEMLSCMMCASTYVGFLFSIVVFSPFNHYFQIPMYGAWFLDGMLASGAVWAINSVIEYFEENRIQKNN
jgi:hypothetical protein